MTQRVYATTAGSVALWRRGDGSWTGLLEGRRVNVTRETSAAPWVATVDGRPLEARFYTIKRAVQAAAFAIREGRAA